ncbi:hypothetical protein CRG98_014927 [Punica granatum]|uniref:Uncharacterized protein n=1 Tax=Punica granatum TaxID=22663 RepID=A0A2I0K844_PUNGR|nr:hypothetical protein CRG98_014927 [Punica granatum]
MVFPPPKLTYFPSLLACVPIPLHDSRWSTRVDASARPALSTMTMAFCSSVTTACAPARILARGGAAKASDSLEVKEEFRHCDPQDGGAQKRRGPMSTEEKAIYGYGPTS